MRLSWRCPLPVIRTGLPRHVFLMGLQPPGGAGRSLPQHGIVDLAQRVMAVGQPIVGDPCAAFLKDDAITAGTYTYKLAAPLTGLDAQERERLQSATTRHCCVR